MCMKILTTTEARILREYDMDLQQFPLTHQQHYYQQVIDILKKMIWYWSFGKNPVLFQCLLL